MGSQGFQQHSAELSGILFFQDTGYIAKVIMNKIIVANGEIEQRPLYGFFCIMLSQYDGHFCLRIREHAQLFSERHVLALDSSFSNFRRVLYIKKKAYLHSFATKCHSKKREYISQLLQDQNPIPEVFRPAEAKLSPFVMFVTFGVPSTGGTIGKPM